MLSDGLSRFQVVVVPFDQLKTVLLYAAAALKDRLKAALGDAESVQAGEYRITWKAITSSRIDTAALKKALPDVAERFSIRSTTRRFSVT